MVSINVGESRNFVTILLDGLGRGVISFKEGRINHHVQEILFEENR